MSETKCCKNSTIYLGLEVKAYFWRKGYLKKKHYTGFRYIYMQNLQHLNHYCFYIEIACHQQTVEGLSIAVTVSVQGI